MYVFSRVTLCRRLAVDISYMLLFKLLEAWLVVIHVWSYLLRGLNRLVLDPAVDSSASFGEVRLPCDSRMQGAKVGQELAEKTGLNK